MPVGKRQLSNNSITVQIRELLRKRREQGLCSCGRSIALGRSISQCIDCLENNRKTWAKMRDRVHDAYGGRCACCSESERKFLAIDHKEGNGNQHRLSVGGHKKSPILRWLIKHNFPPEFQLLCHNCNIAKAIYGVCPHKAAQAEV